MARAVMQALRRAPVGKTVRLKLATLTPGIWAFDVRRGKVVLARGAQALHVGSMNTVTLRVTPGGRAELARRRALHVTIRAAYPSAQGSMSSTISTTWRPGSLRPASRRNGAGTRTP
jgi:hypothetical protein